MTDKERLLQELNVAMSNERKIPPAQRFQQLVDRGIIDDRGNPLKPEIWDAYLAVTAVRPGKDGKISHFRCLLPVFGLPGTATIDISRDNLIHDIRERRKKVVTAVWDDRRKNWRPGSEVRLDADEYLRTKPNELPQDNLGELPEFSDIQNRY